MNSPNEGQKQPDNQELLKQPASACGAGCGCHAAAAPANRRWIIGAIVLGVAGAMAARALIKTNASSIQAPATAFAVPVASEATSGQTAPAANSGMLSQADKASVGTSIGGFAELNNVATNTDAVFIYLPGKGGASKSAPSTPMQEAARMIQSKTGMKCGLYTLRTGTRDYSEIAAQMAVPGVLAMVKGRGMSPVSGEITEANLLQGFVAASSAGGCGPASAGCGPAGCK